METPMVSNQAPGSSVGKIVLAIVLLAVGLVAGYLIGKGKSNFPYQTEAPSVSPTGQADVPSQGTWKFYTKQDVGFAFEYPPDTQVQSFNKEFGEGIIIASTDDKTLMFSIFRNDFVGGVPTKTVSTEVVTNAYVKITKKQQQVYGGPGQSQLTDDFLIGYSWKDNSGDTYTIIILPDSRLERWIESILETLSPLP